jgi:hypothetical protein
MRRLLIPILLMIPVLAAGDEPSQRPRLRLAGAEFHPAEKTPPTPKWFQADRVERSPRGRRYVVAIVRESLSPEQRQQLESAGAELLGYLPDRGYRLSAPPAAMNRIRAFPFVEWLGELPAHTKVLPQLARAASRGTESARIRVVLAPTESEQRVLHALGGLAATAAPSGRNGAWRVTATVPSNRLAKTLSAIAALPEVEAVEPVRTIMPLNQDGVWIHQSFVGPSPQQTPIFDRGIFGCGQIVSVADTAQDHDSCYFADDVNGPPPTYSCLAPPCLQEAPDFGQRKDIIYYNWSGNDTGEEDTCPTVLLGGSGHGTHTSGSVAGDNSPYADCDGYTGANRNGGDGQAPGARLVMLELGDGLEYLNDLGGTIWNIADVAYRSGARIHSFSFGGVCHDGLGQCIAGCTLPYDSLSRDADLAMWTYPDLLLVNAAGNAGLFCPPPVSVVTPALAKNLLAVGGVEHGVSSGNVMDESSRGPVFDGRLRPTLAAQGRAVVSAASDASLLSGNCATCSLDGTSMSAPTTAGLAALAREYYTAGFYASGTRNPAQGFTPSGALLKATLLDGAVDIAAPGADVDSGFGRALLGSTLAFSGDPFVLRVDDHSQGITTGSVVNHAFDVSSSEPFRATLVWTDYPAELNAATARVNELKLEVIDPDGNVWFQTLDSVTGMPTPTMNLADPPDDLNTEERIIFANATAGRWVVRVLGVDVPWGPQPFALVVRGALTDCAPPAAPGSPTLATPADGQVEIRWTAVPGAQGYNVYRSFGSCPGGPWIPVATANTGTVFVDTTVSGGVAYSYHVTSVSDVAGYCESAPSPCASTVPTGVCTLPPEFRGVTTSSSNGTANCSITLNWDPGTSRCTGDLVYNVYRSTAPGVSPEPANLVASCLAGTSHIDTNNLVHDTEYYYLVRAEDSTGGNNGPCRGGNEDLNIAESSTAPEGPLQLGTWTDDAGDTGEAKFELGTAWVNESTGGDSGPWVYRVGSSQLICTDLTSPVLALADPGQGPQLSFTTIHTLDYDPGFVLFFEGSAGQVEIATGPAFSNWTRVPLTPDYPTYIDAPFYNGCSTTQAVANYFSDIDLQYDTYTASLVNWGGQDVRIRFHLSGDLYFFGGDWWIDDVAVTQAAVPGSCSTTAAGPPPIPDGASVPGTPMLVGKNGGDVALIWDAAQCAPTEINIYQGAIGDYSAFTSASCGLAPTGSTTLNIPDDTWFLVVGTDGVDTDGSWSRDRTGAEMSYSGASTVCPTIAQHLPGGVCQ